MPEAATEEEVVAMFPLIASILIFSLFAYFAVITAKPLLDMVRNRLLYRSYLTRAEQALVEKTLSRLKRVVVMSDRIDPPERGFLDAVKDNFSTGVQYVFLVSNRASQEDVDRYSTMFENIAKAVFYDQQAHAAFSNDVTGNRAAPSFEVHRLKQDWNDYPYICYEFEGEDGRGQYLMYRGNEMGVGIASEYVRISAETAYSLIKRADALKAFIAADRENFVDGSAGTLANEPADNVVPLIQHR